MEPEGRPSIDLEIARFEDFTREEVPRLVRQRLEMLFDDERQPAEERLTSDVVDIVRDCLKSASNSYRQGLNTPREDELDNGEGPSSQGATTTREEYPSFYDFFDLDSIPQFFLETPPDVSQDQDELQHSVNAES